MENVWNHPPAELVLQDTEVHVWRVGLDAVALDGHRLSETLSEEELIRAQRFRFERDRRRFLASRMALRRILSQYLEMEPDRLRLGTTPFGKPVLDRGCGDGSIRFNLSHSYELALYAITRGREVGVDLERIRFDLSYEQLAEQFFSQQEVAALYARPLSQRRSAFFSCWTRKEAYVKAKGLGLSIPLDEFSVSLQLGGPSPLLAHVDGPDEISRWSLQELMPEPGYIGAVAVEGHAWRLLLWQGPGNERAVDLTRTRT